MEVIAEDRFTEDMIAGGLAGITTIMWDTIPSKASPTTFVSAVIVGILIVVFLKCHK